MVGRVLWLSIIGSFLNLDEHTVFQSMVSRPIVACPISGFVLGDPVTGFFIGIILELVLIKVLPVGASMQINYSVISILSTGSAILASEAGGLEINPPFILFVLVCTMPMGLVFKELEVLNRRFNIRLARYAEDRVSGGDTGVVEKITYFSIAIAFIKAFIFISLVSGIMVSLLPKLYVILPDRIIEGFSTALLLVFILGLSYSQQTFRMIIEKKTGKENTN